MILTITPTATGRRLWHGWFQCPYGLFGDSDVVVHFQIPEEKVYQMFQCPYGLFSDSDLAMAAGVPITTSFQCPYGLFSDSDETVRGILATAKIVSMPLRAF